jgi:predicted Fe-Mo cluster-binding NifX family protein
MKIAIPLFGKRISPRFDFSPEMWIIEVQRGEVVREEKLFTGNLNIPRRLEQITSNGVERVICGGIDGFSRNELGCRGIDVVQDIIGDAEIAFDLFMKGRLRSGLCCEERGGKGFCVGRRGSRGRRT